MFADYTINGTYAVGGRQGVNTMSRKFWSVSVVFLCIICLASMADAQRRSKPTRGLQVGQGQNENPGTVSQDEKPGNGNQGESPQDPPNGTPDGSTPAEEATCDDLKHGTPGLYGLCIAFCEAHDCVPTYTDGVLDLSSCKKNDRKILDKYRSKMRDGDPDMPCLPYVPASENPETACPCWSQEQLSNFPYALYGSGIDGSDMLCEIGVTWVEEVNDEFCYLDVDYVGETMFLSDGTVAFVDLTVVDSPCGIRYCQGFFGCDPEGSCPDWMPVSAVDLNLEEDEYASCQQQIQQLEPYCNY